MLGCVTVSKPHSRVWAVNRMGNDLCMWKDRDYFFTANKDIYPAASVQATNSSTSQVHCCHRWWDLSLSAWVRNSSLEYFCWLKKAGFGKSAHVSLAFDSARNTVLQSFVVSHLKVFLRELIQTFLIIKVPCLLFLLRSLKMFYLV